MAINFKRKKGRFTTVGELKSGDYYVFHEKVYRKANLECVDVDENNIPFFYVINEKNATITKVIGSSKVMYIEPNVTYEY